MSQLEALNLRNNTLSGFIPLFPASLQFLDITDNIYLFYPQDTLQMLYDETHGDFWKNKTGWLDKKNYCSWHGIECNPNCARPQHALNICPVYRILLSGNNLTGELSSRIWIDGLQELEDFNISSNHIQGTLQSFNVPKLKILDLSGNKFSGFIPNLIMPELVHLRLDNNRLTGNIPNLYMPEIADMCLNDNNLTGAIPDFYMPKVVRILLNNNQLSGSIPNFKMMSLQTMNIGNNQLTGWIPNFDMTIDLKILNVADNNLSGTLPRFENLIKLLDMNASNNQISGSIPRFLFPELDSLNLAFNQLSGNIPDLTIPRLLYLKLGNNYLSGSIPKLLMPLLVELDFKCNKLSGNMPDFTMPRMTFLDLSDNHLTGSIPSLTMPLMEYLNLEKNSLIGWIPNLIMPKLVTLNLSYNKLTGTIPLFESLRMEQLFMNSNELEGNIPVVPISVYSLNFSDNPNLIYPKQVLTKMFQQTKGEEWKNKTGWLTDNNVCSWNGISCDADCPSIQSQLSPCPIKRINLAGNNLEGSLASGTWLIGMRDLEELDLENNRLMGSIPSFKIPGLVNLNLNGNRLSGAIPDFDLPRLLSLYLSGNRLTDFGRKLVLPSVTIVDLSENQLHGKLPPFENLTSLVRLDVSSNQIIAISKLSLPNLQTLLLFKNHISGILPDFNLPQLTYLDLSNNNLDDPLPNWDNLVNLEHFIVSSNQNLTGPLPRGMDRYSKISSVDIKDSNMHTGNNQLLPKTLRPSGQFQMLNPSDKYQCPVLANSNVSRSNILIPPEYYGFHNCRCQPGTFGLRNKCTSCPSKCDCGTGLQLRGCFPSPSLENIKTIVTCSNPSACQTLIPDDVITEVSKGEEKIDTCLKGYEGRVCSKCSPGFGAQGRSHVECQSTLVYASFAIGPILIICFVVYLLRSEVESSGKLGILIFHTQTLSVIATAMSNTPAVEKSMNLPFSVSSIQIPSVSCVFNTTDAFTPLAVSFIRLPILAIVGILAFRMTKGYTQDKVIYVLLNLARCIYYPIALETLGVFSCTLFDEGYDTWYLNAWPWISCKPNTKEYQSMLALAVPTFVVFVCGFPLLLWYIIRENLHVVNQKRSDEERKSRRTRYGFLYMPFNKNYQFWEIITTGRLICFGLVIRIVPYTSLAIIFILLLVLMQGSIWLQYSRNPYILPDENTMELISLYTIYFSYFLVLVSGIVGSLSWTIGLVIAFNGLILAFLLWKTIENFVFRIFRKKGKVSVMVSHSVLPVGVQENSSLDHDRKIQCKLPTDP